MPTDWLDRLPQVADAPRTIADLRGVPIAQLDDVANALVEGGIRFLEISSHDEDALDTVSRWRADFGVEIALGVGDAMTATQAGDALKAGAHFITLPHSDERIIGTVRSRGGAVFAGALTPTEIVQASAMHADAVMVYPVAAMGGPGYLGGLRRSLPHIPMLASGGVGTDARKYLNAGAVAVTVGRALVVPRLVLNRRYDELVARARSLVRATTVPASTHEFG